MVIGWWRLETENWRIRELGTGTARVGAVSVSFELLIDILPLVKQKYQDTLLLNQIH